MCVTDILRSQPKLEIPHLPYICMYCICLVVERVVYPKSNLMKIGCRQVEPGFFPTFFLMFLFLPLVNIQSFVAHSALFNLKNHQIRQKCGKNDETFKKPYLFLHGTPKTKILVPVTLLHSICDIWDIFRLICSQTVK